MIFGGHRVYFLADRGLEIVPRKRPGNRVEVQIREELQAEGRGNSLTFIQQLLSMYTVLYTTISSYSRLNCWIEAS